MNWAAWGPTFVALLACVFTYGRLTEKIAGHSDKIKDLEDDRDAHAARLEKIDLDLMELRAYNRGLSDAAKLSGTKSNDL